MRSLHEIHYQHLGINGARALYLVHQCYLKNKAGVYLSNRCLRGILVTPSRVNPSRIYEFSKSVEYLFPFKEIIRRENNSYGLILGSSDKALQSHHKIDTIPDESEIMKILGFQQQTMEIKTLHGA